MAQDMDSSTPEAAGSVASSLRPLETADAPPPEAPLAVIETDDDDRPFPDYETDAEIDAF